MSLGPNGSFVFSYKTKPGEVRLTSKNIPDNLKAWLYTKDADGDCVRNFEKLHVSFGPDGKSFWAMDGENFIWSSLPAGLETAVKGLIKDGQFTDSPSLVTLGVGGNFFMLTEQKACHWCLTNYEELNSAMTKWRENRTFEEIQNIALSPHKANAFALVFSNGTAFAGGLPATAAAEMQAMEKAIKSDTEKLNELNVQETNREIQLLQQATAQADAQMLRNLRTSEFVGNIGYECTFCGLNPAYCTCKTSTSDWHSFI
jgi:hypothetical protein